MMFTSLISIALLGLTASANELPKRQATDAAQFTEAANQLISQYLPSTALPALQSAVGSAAGAAQVSGDSLSLIYEALLSSSIPGWFSSAIPSDWSTQIAALESNINALRGSSVPGGPIVIASSVVTTTDAAGSTITSTIAPSNAISATTVTSTSVSGVLATTTTTPSGTATESSNIVSSLTTEVINGATSVFSTAVSQASSVASEPGSVFSSLTTEVISGVTSVFSTAVSKASSAASEPGSVVSSLTTEVVNGVTSVFSTAVGKASSAASAANSAANSVLGTSSSTGGGAVPTGVTGAALMGIVGLMVAL